MPPEQWEQVKEAFEAIVDLSAEDRAAALAQLQPGNPDLRAKVEELVANDDRAGDFLARTLDYQEVRRAQQVPRFAAGEIIDGRYEIVRFIGRGGMGEVYEAYDNQLAERLALKTIIPDAALDDRYVARLLQEVRLARKVANRHVCRVHDVGHHQEPWGRIYFFTMELLDGDTLAARLRLGPGMSAAEAFPLIEQMGEALAAAHEEKIIHRDFKPANIMLVPEEGGTRVVVTDFGLARSADAAQTLCTRVEGGNPPGTMGYIAPELFRPGAVPTIACDIYSFGMVIRDMVAGERSAAKDSFAWSSPPGRRWENAIRRCLEHDPERRFKKACDVVAAIRPETRRARLVAWTRRHPAASIAMIVVLGSLFFAPQLARWAAPTQAVTEIRQITSDFGLSDYPVVSHDGKLMVYASDREGAGNLNLYLRQVDGDRRPIRLTRNEADDYAPSFSADDTRIVFRSDRDGGGVYEMSTLGGEPQLLARNGFGPTFSPDGLWIAYWVGMPGSGFVPGSSQVYVKSANGGPAKPIKTDLHASCWPVWSPDSKKLLLVGKPNTNQASTISVDWWVAPLNGGRPVKTSALDLFNKHNLKPPMDYDWIIPIAWLADPNRILFSAMQGDTTNLWEVPVSAAGKVIGPPTRRTFTTALDLHASAMGEVNGTPRRMFFSSLFGRVNIWSLPIDAASGQVTGAMSNLTPGMAYAAAPSISAAGTELAFISVRSKIWSVRTRNLQTGQEAALTSVAQARWLRPRISPDGNTVAYVDNSDHMYLFDALTGTTQKICERCGPPTDVFPGGEKVLFEPLDPPDDVMMIEIPGNHISSVVHSERPDHLLFRARFSPDGRWVAFDASLDNSLHKKVFISQIQAGRAAREADWIPITDGLQVDASVAWSPDGNLLYFLSERDGFRCIWAQRLAPATKLPDGAAFPIRHFHLARESLARVDRFDLIGLSVARDMLVFSTMELTGNIWMEERNTAPDAASISRWIPAKSF